MNMSMRLVITTLFALLFSVLLAAPNLILISSEAQETSRVYGTVYDGETRRPIVGAEVYVFDPDSKDKGEFYQTQTDSGGNYEVNVIPGDYSISVVKDGYVTQKETFTITVDLEHDVVLIPGSGDGKDDGKGSLSLVSGNVTEAETRTPIVGAEVTLYDPEDMERKNFVQTQTDREGKYEIEVYPGDYSISISKDGYVAYKESFTVEGDLVHNVVLTPGSGDDRKDDDRTTDDYKTTDDDNTKTEGDQNDESGISILALVLIGIASMVVSALVVGLLFWLNKSQIISKAKTGKKDDWTTCPVCGSDLRMKDLTPHLYRVHQELSPSKVERLIERRLKQ